MSGRQSVQIATCSAERNESLVVCDSFRPNIVLKGGSPFVEDIWEEITLESHELNPRVETMGMKLVSKGVRCLVSMSDRHVSVITLQQLICFPTG